MTTRERMDRTKSALCMGPPQLFVQAFIVSSTNLALEWSFKRRLSLRRNSSKMPPRSIFPVKESGVGRDSVVPYHDCSWSPLHASLEILALREMVVQEVEKVVTLLFFIPNNASGELRVDEERLLAGRRMSTHKRVDGCDRLAANDASAVPAVIGLLHTCLFD
jgi:hypothetical protein